MDDNLKLTRSYESEKLHRGRREKFPRVFKDVARVLTEVRTQHRSLRSAVYSSKFKGHVLKRILGLALSIKKNLPAINLILQEIGLPAREPSVSLEIAQILIHEIVKNHPLRGQSKSVLIMEKYRKDILKAHSKLIGLNGIKDTTCPYIPRYARVQTTVTAVENVLETLNNEGYVQKHYSDDLSVPSYHEEVRNLKSGEFLQDIHFKDVLVFPNGENLVYSYLYENGHLFLQDKASCLPVYALDPKPESIVLDCCAAPGMKTAHLACLMKNTGHIYAVDRDNERFIVLQNMLKRGHVKNCTASCIDFTSIDPSKEPYSLVQYILIDPSCSGSGMIERMDSLADNDYSKDQSRIKTLSRFQITLLKHALSFPSVERIVYSTCSLYEEENEYVIEEALRVFSDVFHVAPTLPEWPTRGSTNYSFGKFCVRSTPEDNLTNGFFVAVINRINDNEKQLPLGKENFKYPMRDVENKFIYQAKSYDTKSEVHENHHKHIMHPAESAERELLNRCDRRKCKKKKKDKEMTLVEEYTEKKHALKNDPGVEVNTAVAILDSGSHSQMELLNGCERRKCKKKKKDKEKPFIEDRAGEIHAVETGSGHAVAFFQVSECESVNQTSLISSCERRKCKKKRKDKEKTFVEDHVVEIDSLQYNPSDRINTAISVSDSESSNQMQLLNTKERRKCKKKKKDKERAFVEDHVGEIHALESHSSDNINTGIPILDPEENKEIQLPNSCESRKCKKKKKDKERTFLDHSREIHTLEKNPGDEVNSAIHVLGSENSTKMQLLSGSECKKGKKNKDTERALIEDNVEGMHGLENYVSDNIDPAIPISGSESNSQMQLLNSYRSRNCKKRKKKEKSMVSSYEKRMQVEDNGSNNKVDTTLKNVEEDCGDQIQFLKNCERRKCKKKKKDRERIFDENDESEICMLENDSDKNIEMSTQVLENDSINKIQLPIYYDSGKYNKNKNDVGEFIDKHSGKIHALENDTAEVTMSMQISESASNNQVQLLCVRRSRNCKKKKKREKGIC